MQLNEKLLMYVDFVIVGAGAAGSLIAKTLGMGRKLLWLML